MTTPTHQEDELRQAFAEAADADSAPDLDTLWLETRRRLGASDDLGRVRSRRLRWTAAGAAAAAVVVIAGTSALNDPDGPTGTSQTTKPPPTEPDVTRLVETQRGPVSDEWACEHQETLHGVDARRVVPTIAFPFDIPAEAVANNVPLVDSTIHRSTAEIRYGTADGRLLAVTELWGPSVHVTKRTFCTDPTITEPPTTNDPDLLLVRGQPTIGSGLASDFRTVIDTRPYGTFAGTVMQQEMQIAPDACESKTTWCSVLGVEMAGHSIGTISLKPDQMPTCRPFLGNGFSLHGRAVCGFFTDRAVESVVLSGADGTTIELARVSPALWPGHTEYWAATTTSSWPDLMGSGRGFGAVATYADGTAKNWLT